MSGGRVYKTEREAHNKQSMLFSWINDRIVDKALIINLFVTMHVKTSFDSANRIFDKGLGGTNGIVFVNMRFLAPRTWMGT